MTQPAEITQFIFGQPLSELVDEIRAFGARANHADVAAQNIKELRKLIDARPPEKPTDAGNPSVTLRRPDRPTIRFGINYHTAKFQQHEPAAVEPDAFLPIEDGTKTVPFDCESRDCHKGHCKNDNGTGN